MAEEGHVLIIPLSVRPAYILSGTISCAGIRCHWCRLFPGKALLLLPARLTGGNTGDEKPPCPELPVLLFLSPPPTVCTQPPAEMVASLETSRKQSSFS